MHHNSLSKNTRNSSKVKVALVDDHKMFRDSLVYVLDSFEGYEVTLHADNGADFIEKLKPTNVPDIVILDLSMPEMGGYETARWLMANRKSIGILVLTMFEAELVFTDLIPVGVKAFLYKSAPHSELKRALEAVTKDQQFFPASMYPRMTNIFRQMATKSVFLSDKELFFLRRSNTDLTYKEMGKEINVSKRTIENYVKSLEKKLKIKGRMALAMFAIKNGIIEP